MRFKHRSVHRLTMGIRAILQSCSSPLALIFLGLCVARMAAAQPILEPQQIEGRWTSAAPSHPPGTRAGNRTVTVDISRCGASWCGVAVAPDGRCGATSLRVEAGVALADRAEFSGRFELAPNTQPYAIQAYLFPHDGVLGLHMYGNTGDTFRFERRTFPLDIFLARTGEPKCRPDPKPTWPSQVS